MIAMGASLTYDYAADLSSDTAASHVLRLVGQGKRVLELGAGPGAITRELIQVGKCEVVAVDLDEAALEKLRTVCARTYRCDLNDPDWIRTLAGEDRFDAIVVADVLEHLYDPQQALASMIELLRPQGEVVVSIPHAGHLGVVACLLAGDFEYREWGLLDRTHIRFFGVHNMQALFDGAGLAIIDAGVVVRPPERTEFGARWKRLPEEARHALLAANPFGAAYQIVIRAARIRTVQVPAQLSALVLERIGQRAATRLSWPAAAREAARGWARANLSDQTIARLRGAIRWFASRG
jgi:2-polyprenyl-3-methyl-5-hydroxy-6-metoxy-1,4-benzoquinol methylase